ncbi:MAG TPA: bifunctional precorrin-2 dehydrogenase/sirohydrochlorin ferrochelatase, partial [Bryobacteraceae bacterium]|nr:bifunctional precorrin-2 dehydrogenase/sirohydrochlorin ferrochelatase [Bryobacteraceae bacterium]
MSYYYPVLLNLEGKRCLVLGERWSAEERVRGLLEARAQVTVRWPRLRPALDELLRAGRISWTARDYESGALEGFFLAVAATHDAGLNHRIWEEAEARGVLLSSVDDTASSRFIYPAIHRQGDLVVAVSSSGRSPALAAALRDRFASELGPEHTRLAEILGALRPEVAARFPEFETRKRLWQRIVASDVLQCLRAGDERAACELIDSILGEDRSL